MVNNPPDSSRKKLVYRTISAFFGSAVIVITATQAIRGENEQNRARIEAERVKEDTHHDQLESQGKMNYMQGKLEAIVKFESQYIAEAKNPRNGSAADLAMARAILKMAEGSVAQSSPNSLISVSDDVLKAKLADVTGRLQDAWSAFDHADIPLDDQRVMAFANKDAAKLAEIRNERDSLRRQAGINNKQLVVEATDIRDEYLRRFGRTKETDSALELIQRFEGLAKMYP